MASHGSVSGFNCVPVWIAGRLLAHSSVLCRRALLGWICSRWRSAVCKNTINTTYLLAVVWQKGRPLSCYLLVNLLYEPTIFRHNRERDRIASILDELDDIVVRQLHDGPTIDSRDTVSNLHLTYAVCRAALNNTANLVRNNWNRETQRNDNLSFCMLDSQDERWCTVILDLWL